MRRKMLGMVAVPAECRAPGWRRVGPVLRAPWYYVTVRQ